jgi:hypothetical protein
MENGNHPRSIVNARFEIKCKDTQYSRMTRLNIGNL